MTDKIRSNGSVQSIERAFSIIDLLDSRGEMGISELSRHLSLERSTVHRIVSTMKKLGYLTQNPTNAKYFNSFRFFEIGNDVVKRLGLRQQCAPFLRELSELTREAVNLAILDGNMVIYIDKIESGSTIKVDLSVGKRFPPYCTGLGKVLLAWMPESRVEEILGPPPFRRFTPNTPTSMKEIKEEMEKVRRNGFSVDNEEYVQGLLCISAPVRGRTGEVVAALSVALPKITSSIEEEKIARTGEIVMDVASRFSRSLGYSEV